MSRDPSYLSPKCEGRRISAAFRGVFAQEAIPQGEIIAIFGGAVYHEDDFWRLPTDVQVHSLQIEDAFYLVPLEEGPSDWFNHACEPNAGLWGQATLVAMRDIAAGEEVRFDYAMCDSSPYDEFACQCGCETCRGHVSGDDWRLPELQGRYAGYFSAYLARRIAQEA